MAACSAGCGENVDAVSHPEETTSTFVGLEEGIVYELAGVKIGGATFLAAAGLRRHGGSLKVVMRGVNRGPKRLWILLRA